MLKQALILSSLLLLNTPVSLAQQARPNVVLIICDDMRWDSFQPNGGPDFFETPSINRIAWEGANFQLAFNVYSLCIPSRSSIMTGLYPHNNGAIDNWSRFDTDLPTIAKSLDNAGYHTGMIGKYDVSIKNPGGWDYWFVSIGATDYEDPPFKYFELAKVVPGHITQIISDSSLQFISSVDTPFFVTIAHLAPHKPVVPLPQYAGIYDSVEMPIPPNFFKYEKNFPSFIYERSYYPDTAKLVEDLRHYYEAIRGIEDNISSLLNGLEQRGILDETIIIFTNDNGMLFGEHALAGKGLPYEPSMRSPLFIRYPAWFSDSTVVDHEIALTIDIAPTIMEAAGLENVNYGFQGIPLHRLATGELHRDLMLFESIKIDYPVTGDTSASPSFRTIRSHTHKYTRYSCEVLVEELFDLVNDPYENTNLAKVSANSGLLNSMRIRLDSMLVVFNDTLSIDTTLDDCRLVATRPLKIIKKITLKVAGNPASDFTTVLIENKSENPLELHITNLLGQVVYRKNYNAQQWQSLEELNVSDWPAGIYLVTVSNGSETDRQRLLKL